MKNYFKGNIGKYIYLLVGAAVGYLFAGPLGSVVLIMVGLVILDKKKEP